MVQGKQHLLDSLCETYRVNTPQDNVIRELIIRTFNPFIDNNGEGIEFGCSDGYMTELLSPILNRLDVVEGSAKFITMAKERKLKNVEFYHSLFEDFSTSTKYDYIFATYILTHVDNDISFLKQLRILLKPRGLIFIVVPNNRVLSRQLALHMGLINDLSFLTDNDINHGHKRSYDRKALNHSLSQAGLRSIAEGGVMLKPLADFQMDMLYEAKILQEQHIKGLYKLGHEYPDLCSGLYSVCSFED
jgi:2-polyprenyl-3-methyl-5-hydroxy-6-metoxy-1,4-benzoquinol methylase